MVCLAALIALSFTSGCSHHARAPVVQKSAQPEAAPGYGKRQRKPAPEAPRVAPGATVPATHRVVKGDTVHAIAWRYRLDFRDLIRWNKLRNPNLIYVGQRLRLHAPAVTRARPSVGASAPATPAPKPKPAPAPVKETPNTPLQWTWPAQGKVSVAERASGARGIEIRGRAGQSVNAAAGGAVVYSGSGLRGYGELIIIKHNETFLSAYAHNETRLVEEGQRVQPGQTIARMGDTEAREVMLHFEIRRNGKTVDPFRYLPKR